MKYDKLIFVCRDNLIQSPIAAAIMNHIKRDEWLEVTSRGLIVLFPEPYHSKAYSLLQNNGIVLDNGTAVGIESSDFSETTLILAMDRDVQKEILEEFDSAQNVYTVMEFAGGSGNILDPYGGDVDLYAMFYESIYGWVSKVEETLHDMNEQTLLEEATSSNMNAE